MTPWKLGLASFFLALAVVAPIILDEWHAFPTYLIVALLGGLTTLVAGARLEPTAGVMRISCRLLLPQALSVASATLLIIRLVWMFDPYYQAAGITWRETALTVAVLTACYLAGSLVSVFFLVFAAPAPPPPPPPPID